MSAGLSKKYKERRDKRRAKRRASKQDEQARRDKADVYTDAAVTTAQGVALPSADTQHGYLNSLELQGSQAAKASQDAEGLAAQRGALSQQQDIARQGYTAEDAATLQSANRQANLNEQAQRQAVQQGAQMRGQGGGGLAMMGALQAQQSGANRAADQAAQVGQNRIQARQQGVSNVAQQGSQLAGQGLAEAQAKGQALDTFNQNMTQARMGVGQQDFENQLGWAQNVQGALQGGAAYNQQTADANRTRRNSMFSAMTMGNYQ